MNLALAKPFLPSVGKLTPTEQAAIIDFLPRFARDPRSGGFHLERLSGKAAAFHSARINDDIRVILHVSGEVWSALYAAHHGPAYAWAERHEVDRHPRTGVMQIVETQEVVREVEKTIVVPVFVDAPVSTTQAPVTATPTEPAPPEATRPESAPAAPLLAAHDDDFLLSLGLPERWLPTARSLTTEDAALELAQRLPDDVGDRLLDLASGLPVTPPTPVTEAEAFTSPDAQRSFFFADDEAELLRVLQAPMDAWIAFLHPSQRALVTRTFKGPAKISGSAGTGKTVVALHRARHLARQGKRVLLTTFINTLADNLRHTLGRLCADDELARISVSTVDGEARRLVAPHVPRLSYAPEKLVRSLLGTAARQYAPALGAAFATEEWFGVIEPQGITDWPRYRDADRTGRGTPLSVRDRKRLWTAFERVYEELEERRLYTFGMVADLACTLLQACEPRPCGAVIVDG
ncbi:MAG: UvrD-helicase domain-containing protein, partial [Myxococcales bacterium]|nr:UvrD-helicase domain-containing protein [Myxococcales bacterium]